MASMPPVKLGAIISSGYLLLLLFRPLIIRIMVVPNAESKQPYHIFLLDLVICTTAGILISSFNFIIYGFTLSSAFALLTGCILSGFFIGIDTSLAWERKIILQASGEKRVGPLRQRYFPMTKKFTFVAITLTFFVSLVLILIFSRDIIWLVQVGENPEDIAAAQQSVTLEILFIMSVLAVLIVNIIFSFSRNLKLLFTNETRILELVSRGDLTAKVPVATNDEFGIIAGHTNDMIDGLRHRFELLTALQLAHEVQQTLLPQDNPVFSGFDISGTSLYCDHTGGDYFDYLDLPGGRLGIVVADVCGHGVSAAMLMMSVRAFLASAVKNYRNPRQLINDTNQNLFDDFNQNSQFTTLFFLELRPNEKSLRWVRAGHEPPILYEAQNGSFSRLDGQGLVLGIDPDYDFTQENDFQMEPGDVLLIGTDGISEARNPQGESFGIERINETLKRYAELSAHEIQQKLIEQLENFRSDFPREDDVTLVIVKALER